VISGIERQIKNPGAFRS